MSNSENLKPSLSLPQSLGIALAAAIASTSSTGFAATLESSAPNIAPVDSQTEQEQDANLIGQLVHVDPNTHAVVLSKSLFEQLHKEGLLKWETSTEGVTDTTCSRCIRY